jgi:hypothetical protein
VGTMQRKLFEDFDNKSTNADTVIFNKERFLGLLKENDSIIELALLKKKINALKELVSIPSMDKEGLLNTISNEDTISLRKDVLISELQQVLDAQTISRARYYITRLKNSLQNPKTNKVNDINILRWKEYDDISTDSLWVIDKRDTSGAHLGWYWGNFIPQIPHQMMLRYTRKRDWVLDTFVGSGTTLIECRRLGRNGLGIELNPEVAQQARELISKEPNKYEVVTEVIVDDSKTVKLADILKKYSIKQVQLLIMHPPYHDIIKFSEDNRDLSRAINITEFLRMFSEIVENVTPFLEEGRYFALVIGDKYSKGEWIPLGFHCVNEVLKHKDFTLKGIIVKNFEETRAKRNQKDLWRYRAMVGGFYVFKHEYIMIFQKKTSDVKKKRRNNE